MGALAPTSVFEARSSWYSIKSRFLNEGERKVAVKEIRNISAKKPESKFETYVAAIDFNIGKVGPYENLKIEKGDALEYDGESIKYNGNVYTLVSFKGAIKRGWVSLDGSPSEVLVNQNRVKVTQSEKGKVFNDDIVSSDENVVATLKFKVESDKDDGETVATIENKSVKTVINSSTDYTSKIREIEGKKPVVKKKAKKVATEKPVEEKATEKSLVADAARAAEDRRLARIKQLEESEKQSNSKSDEQD